MSIPASKAARVALIATGVGLSVTLAACGTSNNAATSSSPTQATTTSSASSTSTSAGHSMGMGSTTYPPVTPGPAATGAHNDADITFAQGMIPHHGQAVVMADMILTNSGNATVKALAEGIKNAQTPEIATLTGWLKGWSATAPNPYEHAGGMSGMNHGGMMSTEQMNELMKAHGASADKAFLTHMIEHHRGAVDMAETQLAQGQNPQAKALAQTIITSQTAEITTMQNLLNTVG